MSDLREPLTATMRDWLNEPTSEGSSNDDYAAELTDRALAVVQPALGERDAEIRRLGRKVEREQTAAKMAEQHAEQAEAERDRLTDQIRTIRTLRAMWAKIGEVGMPGEREVFALVAADLGKVLDQPGEPTINPQLNVAQPVDQTKDT